MSIEIELPEPFGPELLKRAIRAMLCGAEEEPWMAGLLMLARKHSPRAGKWWDGPDVKVLIDRQDGAVWYERDLAYRPRQNGDGRMLTQEQTDMLIACELSLATGDDTQNSYLAQLVMLPRSEVRNLPRWDRWIELPEEVEVRSKATGVTRPATESEIRTWRGFGSVRVTDSRSHPDLKFTHRPFEVAKSQRGGLHSDTIARVLMLTLVGPRDIGTLKDDDQPVNTERTNTPKPIDSGQVRSSWPSGR